MSNTLEAIIDSIIEHTPLGRLYTLTAGAAGSITDDQELKGPHSAAFVTRGSPIRVRDVTTAGVFEDTFADVYTPSTGQVTVEPDLADFVPAAADKAEIWLPELLHPKRVREKVNQALTQDCGYWTPFILTLVTDGDMETANADIATYWTGTNATPTKVTGTTPPHRFGRQLLKVANSAANGYACAATSINVVPGDSYFVGVLARAGVSTVALSVYDESNGAAITLQGSATDTTQLQWVWLYSQFTIPADCYYITPRLGGASATAETYWTALSLVRVGDRRISLPARITSMDSIGRVYQRYGSEVDKFYRGPDINFDVEQVEEGYDLILPDGVLGNPNPLYAEEWQNYATLGVDETATTNCELEYVRAFTCYRVFKGRWQDEERRRSGTEWRNKWASLLLVWEAEARNMKRKHSGRARVRMRFPGLATSAARV